MSATTRTAQATRVGMTMASLKILIAVVMFVGVSFVSAVAQVSPAEAEQIRLRQQLGNMESALERAISIGAQNVIVEVRRIVPDRPRLLGQTRVSSVRLPGYGILFSVDVPILRLPLTWQVTVRDVQTRDALMAIQQLRTRASNMASGRERTELENQANQLEQQVALGNFQAVEPRRGAVAAASLAPVGVPRPSDVEPSVLADPESAYTREVKTALINAMLSQSQELGIKSDEWLTVVARDGMPNDPQFPGDLIDSTTQVMRVKGSVLAAYQSKAITLEEARKQVEVTEQ